MESPGPWEIFPRISDEEIIRLWVAGLRPGSSQNPRVSDRRSPRGSFHSSGPEGFVSGLRSPRGGLASSPATCSGSPDMPSLLDARAYAPVVHPGHTRGIPRAEGARKRLA